MARKRSEAELRKERLLNAVREAVWDIVAYDRQGDHVLSRDDIATMFRTNRATLDELANTFKDEIRKSMPEVFGPY